MIDIVSSFKLLGVWQQENLKWNTHIEKIARNSSKSLFCLRERRRLNLATEVGIMCYQTKMRSLLEYGAPIWAGIPQYLINKVERIQTRSLRILALPKDSLPSMLQRRDSLIFTLYKRLKNNSSNPCNKFIPLTVDHPYSLKIISNHSHIAS